jgi:hypothetical protein
MPRQSHENEVDIDLIHPVRLHCRRLATRLPGGITAVQIMPEDPGVLKHLDKLRRFEARSIHRLAEATVGLIDLLKPFQIDFELHESVFV